MVVMRRSCSRCAVLAMSRGCECSAQVYARDWESVARCSSKCAAGAGPLESEMYRALGTIEIERNGGSVGWKTLDFEATEWSCEERRRAVGDTRAVGKG